jgi:hypothetical protein
LEAAAGGIERGAGVERGGVERVGIERGGMERGELVNVTGLIW